MAQIKNGTNPTQLISSALESLNFSFRYGRLSGKTELTPQLKWLFTESPIVIETDGEEGKIAVNWGNNLVISYKIGCEENGDFYIRYSVV